MTSAGMTSKRHSLSQYTTRDTTDIAASHSTIVNYAMMGTTALTGGGEGAWPPLRTVSVDR